MPCRPRSADRRLRPARPHPRRGPGGGRSRYHLVWLGEVAERWYELGEVEKAKALLAEGLPLVKSIPGEGGSRVGSASRRGWRASTRRRPWQSPTRSPRAAIITRAGHSRTSPSTWPDEKPADAERVLDESRPQGKGVQRYHRVSSGRWRATDPSAPRRLVEEAQRYRDHPQVVLVPRPRG